MTLAPLLRTGVPPLVGIAYYAVIAVMLAAPTANREPERPAFKISGYALPAAKSPQVKAPKIVARPQIPKPVPPKVPAVAVRDPAAPLPSAAPTEVALDGPADDSPVMPATLDETIGQPDILVANKLAGDPDDRPGLAVGPAAATDVPPSPEDGPLPPPWATPGGSTLVLAVLLGDDGVVLKTKILVPSGDAVANLTYGMALQSARDLQLHVDPPLQPGETRWLVVPVEFRTGLETLP